MKYEQNGNNMNKENWKGNSGAESIITEVKTLLQEL